MSHSRAFSSLDLGKVDVEGGSSSRLDDDYFEGIPFFSSPQKALPWTAAGPMTASAGSSFSREGLNSWANKGVITSSLQAHLTWARAGCKDSVRFKEVAALVRDSSTIRGSLVKGFILSAAVSFLVFFFELTFWPSELFKGVGTGAASNDSSAGSTWNILILYPVVGISFLMASSLTLDVASAGHELHTGRTAVTALTSRGLLSQPHQPLIVINYAAVALALRSWVPYFGKLLSFNFVSFVCAYYCFDPIMANRGWNVERRLRFAESRWAYMWAFGLLPTAVSYFHPSGLLNLFLFMVVYPPFTVLALLANPQPRSSPRTMGLFSSAPSDTSALGGSTPDVLSGQGALCPLLPGRIPIFLPTVIGLRLLKRFFPSLGRPTDVDHRSSSNATPYRPDGASAAWSGGSAPYQAYTNGSAKSGFAGSDGTGPFGRRTAAQFVGGAWQQQPSAYQAQPYAANPRSTAPIAPPPKRGTGGAADGVRGSSTSNLTTGSALTSPQRHRSSVMIGQGTNRDTAAQLSPQEASAVVNSTPVRIGPPPKGKKSD